MDKHDGAKPSDEINPQILDKHYKSLIAIFRDLILQKADAEDTEICRKWLAVFNNTASDQKMARNCLCTLMKEQLCEYGCLGKPFTNLENCKRNLNFVLQDLDNHSDTISWRSDMKSSSPFQTYIMEAAIDRREHNVASLPCKEFQDDYNMLKFQVDDLRMQLAREQMKNAKILDDLEKIRGDAQRNEKLLTYAKETLLERLREKLKTIQEQYNRSEPLKLFESVFDMHCDDPQFMGIIRKFDKDLEEYLSQRMMFRLKKHKSMLLHQMCRKLLRKNAKLRKKFQQRVNVQASVQRLQVMLAELRCFSLLRQTFIRFHTDFGKINLWDVLTILEEKYQCVSQRI